MSDHESGSPPSSPSEIEPESAPEERRIDLTTGGLARGIFGLVWPIMLASLLSTLPWFADQVMVGRLVGDATRGAAAVGMSGKLIFVVMVIAMAITTGAQVLISRSMGARDTATAERAAGQAFIILGLVVGGVLLPFGYWAAPWLLLQTGATPEMLEVGTPYLRFMFLAGPGMLTNFLFASCLQGAGDSRTPLYLSGGVNILNVVLNWILIFGNLGAPAMGVTGAAVGTFLARSIGAVFAIGALSSGRLALRIHWLTALRLDFGIWWRILRVGIPSGLQGFVRAISGWAIFYILGKCANATDVIGGYTISDQIMMLTSFIGFAAMPAAMTVVGQNVGANQLDRAERGGWAVMKLAGGLMCIPAALYFVAAPGWLRLVAPEATVEAQAIGAIALRILCLGEASWAINMALGGALRGGGDTISPLVLTVATQLLLGVGVGAVLVLGFGMGPEALWGATLVSMWIQTALTIWWYRRGRWKSLSV